MRVVNMRSWTMGASTEGVRVLESTDEDDAALATVSAERLARSLNILERSVTLKQCFKLVLGAERICARTKLLKAVPTSLDSP
jgi:hypothetical protein